MHKRGFLSTAAVTAAVEKKTGQTWNSHTVKEIKMNQTGTQSDPIMVRLAHAMNISRGEGGDLYEGDS